MRKTEMLFRILFASLLIANLWFVFQLYPFIGENQIHINKDSLATLAMQSLLIGALLSVPFGIIKYWQLHKSLE